MICDYFSKWTEAFALQDHQATTVADVLVTEIFMRLGVPRIIHSDQAPEFMSELMEELFRLLEIQRTRTCPYRPQSDGLVERFNRTLIDMLSKFCGEHREDWDDHLPYLLCAYRATVNESTGCSPNLLMLGREITLPVDLMFQGPQEESYGCHVEYVEWVGQALLENFEMARDHLRVAAQRQKRYYDRRVKDRQYGIGDLVLRFYKPNLIRSKLNAPYIGPYLVIGRPGEVTYQLQKCPKSKSIVVHVDHLKPYRWDNPPQSWLKKEGESAGLEEVASQIDTKGSPEAVKDETNPSEYSDSDPDDDFDEYQPGNETSAVPSGRVPRTKRPPKRFDDYIMS